MIRLADYPKVLFKPVVLHDRKITPYIKVFEIESDRPPLVSYAGHSAEHLAQLRRVGIGQLPPELCGPGDMIKNGGISAKDFMYFANDSDALFQEEQAKHPDARLIIASNAGNAPLLEWEVNYAADQAAPLSALDFESAARPLAQREYFCLAYGPAAGINIGYVKFTADGRPADSRLTLAVGGRPLVQDGQPAPLPEFLKRSISEPRHLILMPELDLGSGTFIPLGSRTLQAMIRNQRAAEIVAKIKAGEPILIDLALEEACCGPLSQKDITTALLAYGYQSDEFEFGRSSLLASFKFNPYRHTFWAKKGNSIFIGIINNDLPANQDEKEKNLYNRVLKSVGLTIPRLQRFLLGTLKAENAVLLGNGKDCRIYTSKWPHDEAALEKHHDIDVIKKKEVINGREIIQLTPITPGMVSLIL